MAPRRRRLLVIALLVLVAVPVLAAVGVGSYLRSGGLEREIEHGWTAYGMPGHLRVGSVRLLGLDEAEAEEVVLAEDGEPELVRARRVRFRFDALDKRLLSLRVDGARGGLDAGRFRFLLAIIKAEEKHPPTRAPKQVRVEIADGALSLPGGVTIAGVAVQVDALGAQSTAEAAGTIDGRPFRIAVTTSRVKPDAPIVTGVEVREGLASPRALVAVASGLGLVKDVPEVLLPYLPAVADFAGTSLQRDVVADTMRGTVTARWADGEGSCTVDADTRRVVLRKLTVRDQRLGTAAGELVADRSGDAVAFDARSWTAGPGLPLPAGLPIADLARLLPELQVRWPTPDRRTSLAVVGPGRARLEVIVGGSEPPRLLAGELPLVLMQGLLPEPLLIGGGHIVQAGAVLADGRPEFSARLSQARMLVSGWSLGPIDGQVAAVLAPDGSVQVTADLLSGDTPRPIGAPPAAQKPAMGRLTFAGGREQARITVASESIESLLARLRGPAQLPDLSGSLNAAATVTFTPSVQVELSAFDLAGAALRLSNNEFIRDLDARLRGRVQVASGRIEVSLDGHLRRGEVRIPGEWYSLATRTPRFTLDVTARLEQGQLAELVLTRAMVRAADAAGQALPGGFSAQFDGRLAGARLGGTLDGVVDHADLASITSIGQIVPGQLKVGGEGAAVLQVQVQEGRMQRIDGTFLPLGADLDVDQGKLRVGGITGGIRFSIGAEEKP